MIPIWHRRPEAGTRWAIRLYVWFALKLGRGAARVILIPICAYFLFIRAYERRASKVFLQRALKRPVKFTDVAKHFFTFAQVALDRVYLLTSEQPGLDVQIENVKSLDHALAQGRGCLLVGSHLGSFEASRKVSMQRPDVKLRILMDRSQGRNAINTLETLNPELAEQVIDASVNRGMLALQIGEALRQGDLVAVLADRVTQGERSAEIDFMGCKAQLPLSPFLLARVTGAPMVLFFGLFEGGNRYRIIFEPFTSFDETSRSRNKEQLQAAVQAYAKRLEYFAYQSPHNWFNFYPFWLDENP
ncbi:MAG: hypothetical protein OER96_05625 [Gammaproteobacteria bacterium]|nr:hypothetical protein [Gammaproteobacteria bacterium]